MKIKLSKKYYIYLILFLALIIRFWNISNIPPHLTSDEAALGYNAYSILKTGRDEYGKFLPMVFKSFGDYKPGLYVYLTVPFVALLGLNELSVRLPSVLAGVIAVFLLYKIINYFEERKSKESRNNYLGLASALLLALTPWHIHFSRGAWEVNVALTLTLTGLYFFLMALHKPRYLYLSALFFSLTFITYQGAKLSTTIVVFILFVMYWRTLVGYLKNNKSEITKAIIIGAIVVYPIVASFFTGKAGRLSVFSVFSYPRKVENLQQFLGQGGEEIKSGKYYLYHTETLNYVRSISGRWYNHFSGRFLFFGGDWSNPRHSAPNSGMLLFVSLFFLVFGFKRMVKNWDNKYLFVILWLLLSPLPAALSRDQVHAVRALNMVIPLTMISSLGIVEVIEYLKEVSKRCKYICIFASVFILMGSVVYYLDAYFVHLGKHDSQNWNYGYKQIVETIVPLQGEYEKTKIQQSFAQPYIFFLFFGKYPPKKYQTQAKLVASEYVGDVGYVERLDNIYFTHLNWAVDKEESGIVVADSIVIPDESLGKNQKLIQKIDYLDGNEAFKIVEVE